MWEMPLTVQQQGTSYNNHLNRTLCLSVFFFLSLFSCVSPPFSNIVRFAAKWTAVSQTFLPPPVFVLHHNTKSTSNSSISLFIKLIKTQYIKAQLPSRSELSSYASITTAAPLRGSTHDMYYPHNHYYFNKISFVFIKGCLIVILHVWIRETEQF